MHRPTVLLAGCVLLAGLLAPAPHAAFHLMKVVEVFPGTSSAPDAQYVVLQMYASNQNFVGNHSIRVYDASNTQIGVFTFPAAVPSGTNQSKILIATPAAVTLFGVTANLTMNPILVPAGGKVCFDAIDCVAWGSYSVVDVAVGTPIPGCGGQGLALNQAIHRRLDIAAPETTLQATDDTGDSANDFFFGLPTPVNNSGQAGTIPPSTCGNGVLESLEACDDANATDGDGCSSACIVEGCGNCAIDTGETCDDGNADPGDGCRADCTVEECADGILDAGEACDDGNTDPGDGCRADCTIEECGDGILDPGEGCDDGNVDPGDGCRVDCTIEECGDGILDPGEECEPPGEGTCDAECNEVVIPGEVSGLAGGSPLRVAADGTVSWERPGASGSDTFNVYRGETALLPSGDYGICFATGLVVSSTVDAAIPPSGTVWTYLVTGVNAAGEGSLGTDSSGAPRPNLNPCP